MKYYSRTLAKFNLTNKIEFRIIHRKYMPKYWKLFGPYKSGFNGHKFRDIWYGFEFPLLDFRFIYAKGT